VSDTRFLVLLGTIVLAGVIASEDKDGSALWGGLIAIGLFVGAVLWEWLG
jgi:hypothetical protein